MSSFETLHCHTITSDGNMTYLEVLDACKKYGISVVAFTDHDAVPDVRAIKLLRQNSAHDTKWISGIEITAPNDVHIVGLFIDPTSREVIEHCQKAQEDRDQRMEKTVRKLRALGFDISAGECRKVSEGKSIGKPHIVQVLMSKSKNVSLVNEFVAKMAKVAKTNKNINKLYKKMVKSGKHQYPYQLFLVDNAFVEDTRVEREYTPSIAGSSRIIRRAGGIASIAHYTFAKRHLSTGKLEGLFANRVFDGGEVVYGVTSEDKPFREEILKDSKVVRDLIEKYSLVATGGVDAHCEEHFKEFVEDDLAKQTIGMTDKAVLKSGVCTEWSSL